MKDLWETALVDPLRGLLEQVGSFLPHLLVMIVVLAVGILAAWSLRFLLHRILVAIKFDPFCARVGLSETLTRGGVTETPSHLVSRIVYWTVILIFLMLGMGALNLDPVDQFVTTTLTYLPHLIVAVVILIMGVLLGNFFSRAMLIAAVNAQVSQARLLARGVRLVVILFALAMALEQLRIAETVIVMAFSIAFGGVVLALAIAFGLGAKDAAKELIERRIKRNSKPKEQKNEDLSHL